MAPLDVLVEVDLGGAGEFAPAPSPAGESAPGASQPPITRTPSTT